MNKPTAVEEILDIVDERDEVIGCIARSDFEVERHTKRIYVRAVWLFIVNSQGKLWIPRRVLTKKVHPGAIDGSAVGCVSCGESYEQALYREVEEELNMNLSHYSYREIGFLTPFQHGTIGMTRVYELLSNEVPQYNPEDYFEYAWLTPQEIMNRVAHGEKYKTDLPVVIRNLYLKR